MKDSRKELELILNTLICKVGDIKIGTKKQFPFGWRKAAKGRTVWRILEEAITQNLEFYLPEFGFETMEPATSEVGIFDFKLKLKSSSEFLYVNIKSSVKGGRSNKDDISKATKLRDFYISKPKAKLFIATFQIVFNDNMSITLDDCVVLPTHWIPDIYVNPSNGNLQSSKTKVVSAGINRSNTSFVKLLEDQISEKL